MTRADDVTTSREDVGRVPRRRGAVNGFLVVLLGLWGASVPLFGPYLGLSYGTDDPWVFSGSWLLLSLLPGVAVVLGGLGLIGTVRSVGGVLAGWLAALGGAWFVLGQPVSTLWNGGEPAAGEPLAASAAGRLATELLVFSGIGVLIVFLAAVALGRFTAGTGRTVVTPVGSADTVPDQDRGDHDHLGDHRTGRFGGRHHAGERVDADQTDAQARDDAQRRDPAMTAAPARDDRTEYPAEQTQAMRRSPRDHT